MPSNLKLATAILVALTSTTSLAQMRAVEEINGEVGLSFGGTNYESVQQRSLGLDGRITFPISTYFGASLTTNASRDRMSFDSLYEYLPSYSCDTNNTSGSVGVFARDYDTGKIGVSYSRYRNQSCWLSFYGKRTENHDSQAFSIYGDYYLNQWTLGAGYRRSNPLSEEWFRTIDENYTAGVLYYPINTLAASVSINHTRNSYESDFYAYKTTSNGQSIGLEYQPAIFENKLSLGLGFTHQKFEVGSTNAQSIGVSFRPDLFRNAVKFGLRFSHQKNEYSSINSANISATWSFEKLTDLITRDRRYR